MTDIELKTLKDNLWHSADMLRAGAHLAANKYGQPILGLIFLRYADILFKQHKKEIDAEYEQYKGTRMEKDYKDIAIEKCGFFLPECAYFDTINNAPDNADKAVLVKKAMEEIEKENPKMQGVLPKEVYGQLVPEEEPELLSRERMLFDKNDILRPCEVLAVGNAEIRVRVGIILTGDRVAPRRFTLFRVSRLRVKPPCCLLLWLDGAVCDNHSLEPL